MTFIIINIIDKLFLIYTIMLLIRVFSSWVPDWNHTAFMRIIATYTEPYLYIFRRIVPPLGMLDLSPIIAFIALGVLRQLTINFLIALQ